MGYWDVVTGDQTWSDYISGQERIKGFENALQKQNMRLEKVLKVGLVNQQAYQTALESGLGTLGSEVVSSLDMLNENTSGRLEFGFDLLSNGIDKLNADFNIMMGDLIWRLEVQSDTLVSILKTLQAPLGNQAKELRRRAEDAYQNGWHEEALKDFLESEHKNYQDFIVHRSIGNIYLYHLIELPKALEYFCKAAKYARPRNAVLAGEAEYFAGVVCSIQHNFEDALTHMSEAIELNSEFYDAFYMRAGFASMLGDARNAVESLETAIEGDSRYHERAKTAQTFDKVRPQIQSLLDRLMQEARSDAREAKLSIDNLHDRCASLLPEGQSRITQLFSDAELSLAEAKTYNDYLKFLSLPAFIESQINLEEQKKIAKERLDKESAERAQAKRNSEEYEKKRQQRLEYEKSRDHATRVLTNSFVSAVISYFVFGLGGCLTRIVSGKWDAPGEGNMPFRAWTNEAFYIAIAIAIVGCVWAAAIMANANSKTKS